MGIEVPAVRRRLLGAELRRLRTAAGLSLVNAAAILEMHGSSLSRIEVGARHLRPRDVRALLAGYGVAPEHARALADLARHTKRSGWWDDYRDVLPEAYMELVRLELAAAEEWVFEATTIPALVQTEDYARCIVAASLTGPEAGPERDASLLAAQRARQQLLTQWASPLRLRMVVGEAALRQLVGGAEVMQAQLDHLVRVCDGWPQVTLQVLPFDAGAHAGSAGSFTVLRFPEPAGIAAVYADNVTGTWVETDGDVERYRRAFEYLAASALAADASAAFIEKTAQQL